MSSRLSRLRLGLILAVGLSLVIFGQASAQQEPSRAATAAGQQPAGQRRPGQAQSSASSTKNLPFNVHDLSGFWRGSGEASRNFGPDMPPMTPWAQARFEANIPGLDGTGGRNRPLGNDPIMICDPVGFPRIQIASGGYGLQIVQAPREMLILYDWFYARRDIWTDGRKLPEDPEPHFYGNSVGRWEGDTFVVESNGFDERTWLDSAGHPHSDQMTLEERYHRTDHDTIEVEMTLTDPKGYTRSWVAAKTHFTWYPADELKKVDSGWEDLREDVCVPSEEAKYKELVREPAARGDAAPKADNK